MIAYARARTKSLLSRFFNAKLFDIEHRDVKASRSNEFVDDQIKQSKERFFDAVKNGGIFLS
tara:strand:- start:339 stop:524 length:186 start_codon:yes stop_codon:yes gene_type:complete